MSLKMKKIVLIPIYLFFITMFLILFVCYNHDILMVNYAKPNLKLGFVRYNRDHYNQV